MRAKPLPHRAAGVLSDGDRVQVQAGADGVRFLLLAAKPIREPVVQYGPFVMNTREEIEQALADYRDGTAGRGVRRRRFDVVSVPKRRRNSRCRQATGGRPSR